MTRLDAGAAARIARELYGLDAFASPLPSERDQNFLIETRARVPIPPGLPITPGLPAPPGLPGPPIPPGLPGPPGRFVLKISNPSDSCALLEAQNAALVHLAARHTLCPRVLPDVNGRLLSQLPVPITERSCAPAGPAASSCCIRLLTWLPGAPLATRLHQPESLLEDLGGRLADLDQALMTFDHPAIHRDFHWDLANGFRVVREGLRRIPDAGLRRLVERLAAEIERRDAPIFERLRRSAIHNDANDHNVLVARAAELPARDPKVAGFVDFGDMVHTWTAAELAIAIAYIMLDKANPLAAAAAVVRGYHAQFPLHAEEVAALFGLACLRLCMSVCIAALQCRARPGDEYLAISQAPIRRMLPLLAAVPARLAEARFRHACGLAPVECADRVAAWLASPARSFAPLVCADPAPNSPSSSSLAANLPATSLPNPLSSPLVLRVPNPPVVLDLSVSSPLASADPRENTEPAATARIQAALRAHGASMGVGRYNEARLCYTAPLFLDPEGVAPADHPLLRAAGSHPAPVSPAAGSHPAPVSQAAGSHPALGRARAASPLCRHEEGRTVHLGLDLFAPPRTPVHAPLDGTVVAVGDNRSPQDYGPVMILRHQTDSGESFHTLYGHLSRESLATIQPGALVRRGECFATLGGPDENGGWTPHVHFQIILDLFDLDLQFPGVCRASERAFWCAVSPDPNLIARLPVLATVALDRTDAENDSTHEFLAARRRLLGPNLSLSYRNPVRVARGWMQYLYDDTGRRYLDAYNNVPHVGHCHPRTVRAATEAMRVLNTNTRYLHPMLIRYAEQLAATVPAPLGVCYFVNSGSEANELALRLARAHTRQRDIIVLEGAYHGNTTTLVGISPYKFSGPGGGGPESWVQAVPIPDVYRGPFKGGDRRAGEKYASFVESCLDDLKRQGRGLAAFIAESAPSVGGQIILPPGYLEHVYRLVRAAGGVCIADEVQTAYGRLGTAFYGFETQRVVPDIVVLGKPIGNGHPIGAVITTPAIAQSFDTGMEFFSTFGGNTVSCAIGLAVLDVVRDEHLQDHARAVGAALLDALRPLADRHPFIGDVRGSGLFVGVELVRNRETLEPARLEAAYAADRLRELGILLGTEGPFQNVLKIRPPMPFAEEDARHLASALDRVLAELEADWPAPPGLPGPPDPRS